MANNPTPPVNAQYGAPMGRRETHEPLTGNPFRLQMIAIDRDGYDPGGAYWGIGAPLFFYTDGGTEAFIRATNRENAKELIREKFPGATFESFDAESYDIDSMVTAYLEAALWAELDESDEYGGIPLGESFSIDDVSEESMEKARTDCLAFIEENESDLAEIDAPTAGHDFWLTRNHHGAGFWDRGLGDIGDRLSESAHSFGEVYIYIGDDDELHLA